MTIRPITDGRHAVVPAFLDNVVEPTEWLPVINSDPTLSAISDKPRLGRDAHAGCEIHGISHALRVAAWKAAIGHRVHPVAA